MTEVRDVDRWTAAHCRALGRLFAVCGEAGATGRPPDVALGLTSLAGQLAWHAELLAELLPAHDGVDPDELVALPVEGTDAALDRLGVLAARGDTTATCVVLARVVLPRLLAGVRVAVAGTDPRLDGARARALTLVARDLDDASGVLEALAERVLAEQGGAPLDAAMAVERDLLGGGVVLGLVPVHQEPEDRRRT